MRRPGSRPVSCVFALTLLALLAACRNEVAPGPDPATLSRLPVLAATDTTVRLHEIDYGNTALAFTWTPGSNHGTNAAIDYALEFDTAGGSFAAPVVVPLGRDVYARAYTVAELESFLTDSLGIAPGTSDTVRVRLRSATSKPGVDPDFSNVVTLVADTYEPASATLYLIGSAAPNGWSADGATPLTPDPDLPFVFTWTGNLAAGQFKFITTLGQFVPSYNRGAADSLLVYRASDADPDSLFTVTEPGPYAITANLVAGTLVLTKQPGPPFDQLWVVGDATPKGWNLDSAAEMRQDPNDPFVFHFNEVLNVGELKIATAKDWGAPFYRPTSNHPPLSDTSVRLSAGDPDDKWYIPTAGPYKITLDLRSMTIAIQAFTPYTQLWMVGDATPAGWNIDAPTAMQPDPNDPYVFTYDGPLAAGEFKFPVATGDWGTDYFMPYANHPPLTTTEMQFVRGGQPDLKWQVADPGTYHIALDQLHETIVIQKQ